MKKTISITLFLLILLMNCNVFDSKSALKNKLEGSWVETYQISELDLIIERKHTFTNGNRSSVIELHYDLEGNFLGHASYIEGKYKVEDKALSFSERSIYYSADKILFQTIEELKGLSPADHNIDITYSLDFFDNYNRLNLHINCQDPTIKNVIFDCAPASELRRIKY